MDFNKIYVGQKAYDKMRLGYVETISHPLSKNTENPKIKGIILKNQKIK
jgi:hypothetical protein